MENPVSTRTMPMVMHHLFYAVVILSFFFFFSRHLSKFPTPLKIKPVLFRLLNTDARVLKC